MKPNNERVAIFVDAASMWIDARRYGEAHEMQGSRINYNHLRKLLIGNRRCAMSMVYLRQVNDLAKFETALLHMGYTTRSLPGDAHTAIKEDMERTADSYDVACLVSREGDYTDLLSRLVAMGKRIEVHNFDQNDASILIPKEPGVNIVNLKDDVLMTHNRSWQ